MKAQNFISLLEHWACVMEANRNYLIELDSVVGDSDLGLTMSDGFRAAANAVKGSIETDIGKLAYMAGKAMSIAVPSTMGTLMASGLMNAGKVLKGQEELDALQCAAFFAAYLEGVKSRGKAELGEKTFLDGLYPAVAVLQESASRGEDVRTSANQAAIAAQAAFQATRGMLARHGRMAIRGEQSREMLDPGAAVAALLMKGYAEFLADGVEMTK